MTNVLMVSESYIKENSNLNDNCFGKTLLPAIRQAQDIYLQQIIGSSLYNSILGMIDNETIGDTGNSIYKELLDDYIRPYLLYKTINQIIPMLSVKLSNYGATLSSDEYLVNLTQGEAELMEKEYSNAADFYCRRLQEFILNHCDMLNIDECTCNSINANLQSAATTGIFLGGQRGRKIVPGPISYRR